MKVLDNFQPLYFETFQAIFRRYLVDYDAIFKNFIFSPKSAITFYTPLLKNMTKKILSGTF